METKTYKSYAAAVRANKANSKSVIVRVGDIYVVGEFHSTTEVAVINDYGNITGHVTLQHLERLGNANYAEARLPTPSKGKIFYKLEGA